MCCWPGFLGPLCCVHWPQSISVLPGLRACPAFQRCPRFPATCSHILHSPTWVSALGDSRVSPPPHPTASAGLLPAPSGFPLKGLYCSFPFLFVQIKRHTAVPILPGWGVGAGKMGTRGETLGGPAVFSNQAGEGSPQRAGLTELSIEPFGQSDDKMWWQEQRDGL